VALARSHIYNLIYAGDLRTVQIGRGRAKTRARRPVMLSPPYLEQLPHLEQTETVAGRVDSALSIAPDTDWVRL
jgi:hypothetical protein